MDKPVITDKGILVLSTSLTILAPRRVGKSPRGRSAIYTQDTQHTFRMAQEKYAAVQDAATALGMATAEFIRWVSYAAANEVLRIERETKYNTPVKTVTPVAEPYRQGVAVPMSFDPYKAR